MVVASFVVSLVAAVLAALSVLFTRSQARSADRQVHLMREEVAAAAEQRESRRSAPWVLSHFQGDAFALTNTWLYALYDVEVVIPYSTPWGPRTWEQVDATASVTFLAPETEAFRGGQLEVQWRETPAGEVRSWQTTLPAWER
jgi:hypothetical protein